MTMLLTKEYVKSFQISPFFVFTLKTDRFQNAPFSDLGLCVFISVFEKLRFHSEASLLNSVPYVPYVPACPNFRRALVPSMLACPRAQIFGVPSCLLNGLPSCPNSWRALVPSMSACPRALVPKFSACPRAFDVDVQDTLEGCDP